MGIAGSENPLPDEGLERLEARDAKKDVAALERALAQTRRRLERLEAKREQLLRRLDVPR